MKIRLAIVSPDLLPDVDRSVAALRAAVDTGDMDAMDSATATLLTATARCRSVELSEQAWRDFVEGIRRSNPAFGPSYLLPGELCTPVLPAAGRGDVVLELPVHDTPGPGTADV